MFARIVRMTLKTPAPEFTRVLENDIIPLLRKQKGFLDEIAFVSPEKKEAVAISLWDRKEMAELYHKEVYPEVLKLLGKALEETLVLRSMRLPTRPSTSSLLAWQREAQVSLRRGSPAPSPFVLLISCCCCNRPTNKKSLSQ